MLPRFRLATKITVAAIAAMVIPEKGLFNMTPEQAAALKTCGLSTLQQVSDKLHAELVCSTCHEQSRRASPQHTSFPCEVGGPPWPLWLEL